MRTRAIQVALMGMALMLSAAIQAAPLVNGGFEAGDFTGWDCGGTEFGGATVLSSLAVPSIGPTQGANMAMVSNGGGNFGFPAINLGLPPGAPNCGGANASPLPIPVSDPRVGQITIPFFHDMEEIGQTFSVSGPMTLSFDWNYLSNDCGGCDAAFVSISKDSLQVLATGGGFPNPVDPADQANGEYAFQSGWVTSQLMLPSAGDYTLVFGVANGAGDNAFASALLVDNIRVVPEPASLALLAVGLAGIGWVRGRKAR